MIMSTTFVTLRVKQQHVRLNICQSNCTHTRLVNIVGCLFLRFHDAIRRTPHIARTRHNQLAHIVKHTKATNTVRICIYISMCMSTYLSMCLHTCICISMEKNYICYSSDLEASNYEYLQCDALTQNLPLLCLHLYRLLQIRLHLVLLLHPLLHWHWLLLPWSYAAQWSMKCQPSNHG